MRVRYTHNKRLSQRAFLTLSAQKYIDEALAIGMTDYLVKPYKKDDLICKIIHTLER